LFITDTVLFIADLLQTKGSFSAIRETAKRYYQTITFILPYYAKACNEFRHLAPIKATQLLALMLNSGGKPL